MNDQTFNQFGDVLAGLFDSMFPALITNAVSLCAIWGCYFGFKVLGSGGDENKRKKGKSGIASFVIGVVVIFLVAVAAPILISALSEWMTNNQI